MSVRRRVKLKKLTIKNQKCVVKFKASSDDFNIT